MRRRLWLLILVLSSAALGVSWVLWGVPRAEKFLYPKVKKILTSRLHRPVRLDGVRLNPLLLSITLENLRVPAGTGPDAPELFACRRWTLFLTPIHRSRQFPWFSLSIGKSTFDVPVLHLDALPPSAGGKLFPGGFPIFPAHRLEWSNGSIHFPAYEKFPSFTLSKCEGTAVVTNADASVDVNGVTPWGPLLSAGRLEVASIFNRSEGLQWKVLVSLPEGRLEEWLPLLPAAVPGRGEGTVGLTLTMQGGSQKSGVDRWGLDADFKKASWTFDRRPWPLSGRLRFASDEVATDGFALGPLKISGKATNPWKSPRMDASLVVDDLPLDDLRMRLPWKPLSALPWRGKASLTASIKGSLERPDLRVSFKAENAGAGPLVLPGLKATLTTKTDRFILDAFLAGGRIHAEAKRTAQNPWPSSDWEGHAESLSLDALAAAGKWGKVGGSLNGNFALRREPVSGEPLAGGVLRLERPAWGDYRLDETVIAYFSWRNDAIRFHNKSDTLDVLVRRTLAGWNLERLSYTRADGMALSGEGSIDGSEKNVSFKASLRQASLRDIPVLLERFPDVEGRWQADVSAEGTLAAPRISLFFEGSGARLRRDAEAHSFRGRARWESASFSLDELRLDDAWKAAAVRSSDGQWLVNVTADGADAALFREISRSSAPVSGRFSASLSASGGGDVPWEGSLRSKATDLRWESRSVSSAVLRADWGKDRIRVGEFSVAFASRSFSYDGEFLRRSPSEWTLSVEGPGIERAEGLARLGDGTLSVRGVKLGDGMVFDGYLDLPRKFIRAGLRGEKVQASALARRTGTDWPRRLGGSLSGEAKMEGPFSSPAFSLAFDWSDARWREVPLMLSFRGGWAGGPLRVDQALFTTPDGGRLECRGAVSGNEEDPLTLSIEASGLPATAAGFLSGGTWGGEAVLEGSRRNPQGRFSMKAAGVRFDDRPPVTARLAGSLRGGTLIVEGAEAFNGESRWTLRPKSFLRFVEGGVDFDVTNDVRNVRAGPVSFFGGLRLTGSWRASPARLTTIVAAEDLWINQQVFDKELARVTWSKDRLAFDAPAGASQRLTGAVDLSDWPGLRFEDLALWLNGDRLLRLNGSAGPSGPWNFSFEGHGLESGILLSLADLDVSGDGAVDVFLTGRGSGADPTVEAEVVGGAGTLGGVPYDGLDAAVSWSRNRVQLRRFKLFHRKGYVLSGTGEMAASEERGAPPQMSFLLRLTNGNLALLKELWPDCVSARGAFEGELSLTPGKEGPVVDGSFSLDNASVRADKYVGRVKDLTVRLRMKDNRVFMEDVSGREDKGRFVLEGSVGLEGGRVKDYDLRFRTLGRRGIPFSMPQLSVPPGPLLNQFSFLRKTFQGESSGEPRAEITIKGPHGSHVIAGEIILEDSRFTYPPLPGAFGLGNRGTWWWEFWREATWDVTIKTGKNSWYRNEFVNARVDGWLTLLGPKEALKVDGKIRTDQGIISYLGQPFQIKQAVFEVVTDTRPGVSEGTSLAYISGEAERSATTIDASGVASMDVVTMSVPRSRLGEIRPRFASRNNPGLSSERVFQKLLGFSSQDSHQGPTTEEQDQLLRAGLVQLVGSSAGPFANRLAQLFGIDMIAAVYEPTAPLGGNSNTPQDVGDLRRLAVEPAGARSTMNTWSDLLRGTGASAGVKLSDRIFGVYKFKVDQSPTNQVFLHDEVQVVGRVVGNIYLKFSTELDTRSLLGQPPNRQILLERQWRFGLPSRKPENPKKETPAP